LLYEDQARKLLLCRAHQVDRRRHAVLGVDLQTPGSRWHHCRSDVAAARSSSSSSALTGFGSGSPVSMGSSSAKGPRLAGRQLAQCPGAASRLGRRVRLQSALPRGVGPSWDVPTLPGRTGAPRRPGDLSPQLGDFGGTDCLSCTLVQAAPLGAARRASVASALSSALSFARAAVLPGRAVCFGSLSRGLRLGPGRLRIPPALLTATGRVGLVGADAQLPKADVDEAAVWITPHPGVRQPQDGCEASAVALLGQQLKEPPTRVSITGPNEKARVPRRIRMNVQRRALQSLLPQEAINGTSHLLQLIGRQARVLSQDDNRRLPLCRISVGGPGVSGAFFRWAVHPPGCIGLPILGRGFRGLEALFRHRPRLGSFRCRGPLAPGTGLASALLGPPRLVKSTAGSSRGVFSEAPLRVGSTGLAEASPMVAGGMAEESTAPAEAGGTVSSTAAMNFSLLVAAALVAALTGPSLNLAEELPRDKREDHSVCLSGHQLSNDSDFICEPCSAGTYREIAVSSKCQKCPKGSYSRAGAAACSKCWPGSFAASSGSANCQKCAKGSMASTDGLSSCTPCPAGSFISFSGSPACVQCPAGTWSKAGAAKCSKCQPGHVSPAGAAACTSCPAGKFSSRSGSIECTPCPAGSFSAAGASACTRCPAGQFSEEGSKQCKACPPGTFSDAEGAAECQQCDRNFALAIRSGMTKCDLCPGGGASFGENRCYKKVKVSCRESTPNCERTIDNDVHSYGQALHKLHSKPTDPESGTHFVYKFGTSINLRGVIVWGKYGCCREGSRILQVVVMPNNAKIMVPEALGSGLTRRVLACWCCWPLLIVAPLPLLAEAGDTKVPRTPPTPGLMSSTEPPRPESSTLASSELRRSWFLAYPWRPGHSSAEGVVAAVDRGEVLLHCQAVWGPPPPAPPRQSIM
uniref:Ephrin_rec_like domain-containing protein n=1 Tax=Macrostomum lignano TaxID=282301 RepID=A0A1I8FS73_9PLAT